jgi:hypothetical protein
MVTVLDEECTTQEHRSVMHFLWAKRFSAKDIHKEMFPVYGGKCVSQKAVHKWAEKHGKRFACDKEVEIKVWKWLRQQSGGFMLWVSTHW